MKKETNNRLRSLVDPLYRQWKDKLFRYEYTAPDIREEAIRKANDPELPEYERQRFQNLVDAGEFDAKELVIDEKAAEQYEKAVERTINSAIKSGELPKPKTPAIMKKLMDKSKQHARRKATGGKPTQ